MPGYSGTLLARKLGLKPGQRLAVLPDPSLYDALVPDRPEGSPPLGHFVPGLDLVHLFVDRRADLESLLPRALESIHPDGTIWVSWPKKASKVPTDITEDTIRTVALPLGLVDVKVCAVSDVWSGLKLVVRLERRS